MIFLIMIIFLNTSVAEIQRVNNKSYNKRLEAGVVTLRRWGNCCKLNPWMMTAMHWKRKPEARFSKLLKKILGKS